MPKITFIGAGSTIFLRHLLGDALLMPSLSNAEIALMDIDEQRLAESELVARRVVETLKAGASRREVVAVTEAPAFSVSTTRLATSSDSARRCSSISISAISALLSEGISSASLSRCRRKIVEPAPIKVIFGISKIRMGHSALGRAEGQPGNEMFLHQKEHDHRRHGSEDRRRRDEMPVADKLAVQRVQPCRNRL